MQTISANTPEIDGERGGEYPIFAPSSSRIEFCKEQKREHRSGSPLHYA